MLIKAYDVHIAFDYDGGSFLAYILLRGVQRVKVVLLLEDHVLRRIQVLGIIVIVYPAAPETYDLARSIDDGKDHPVSELVVVLALFSLRDQSQFQKDLFVHALSLEVLVKAVPFLIGIAYSELLQDAVLQASFFHICVARVCLLRKSLVKESCSLAVYLVVLLPLLVSGGF